MSELGNRASYEAEEREPRREHTQLGDRVAHVLNAAEEAANQIRVDARREGVRIIQEAEATAATRVDELTREAEQLREDAEHYARDRSRFPGPGSKHEHRRQPSDERGPRKKPQPTELPLRRLPTKLEAHRFFRVRR